MLSRCPCVGRVEDRATVEAGKKKTAGIAPGGLDFFRAEFSSAHLHHRGVFLVGARGVEWNTGGFRCIADEAVLKHVGFDLLAADVGEHFSVDDDAGRERLAAQLLHLEAVVGILDDVLLGVGKVMLLEYGSDAAAPAAVGLQVGSDFGFVHRCRSARG